MTQTPVLEQCLDFKDPSLARDLFGPQNQHLRIVERKTGVKLDSRGTTVFLKSKDQKALECASNTLMELFGLIKSGKALFPQDVKHAVGILSRDPSCDLQQQFKDQVFLTSSKKSVVPRTPSQRLYLEAMRSCDMVFAIGPAGTGKTYLAVAMALDRLTKGEVKRLILTRPAVEAGEKLGFLPGDLVEKINPYLRPLYDALHDMLPFNQVRQMMEEGAIEVAPLAFMRGRTLNEAAIILDEAQNTTQEQMKMFLTRMGFGSKAVITGDVTQIDLPTSLTGQPPRSGLVHAREVLADVEGLSFVQFDERDVIRHPLVGRIVGAYDKFEKES